MVKEVIEFDGKYFVSNDGRVFGQHMKVMKPSVNPRTGYCQLCLRKDGRGVTRYVHRLVAEAFLEKPEETCEVNHKDGNKQNNTALNLEWVDRSANMKHAYQTGLRSNKVSVTACTVTGEPVQTFASVKEASQFCGVGYNAGISNCLSGKTKTAHGYVWKRTAT